jgi:hypothetical protein
LTSVRRKRKPYHLPQSAAHAVTFNGVSHLSRYGEPDANRPALGALPRLEHEGAARSPHAASRGLKVAPAFQPFDNDGTSIPLTH